MTESSHRHFARPPAIPGADQGALPDHPPDGPPADHPHLPIGRLVDAHIAEHIGPVRRVFAEPDGDQMRIDVHHVPPSHERAFHVLVTTGMSDRPMETPDDARVYRRAELLVCLPSGWPVNDPAFEQGEFFWPVRWLRRLARFPHEQGTWLGAGHSVPNGDPPEPIAPDTELCGFLLLPPLSLPVAARRLVIDAERTVHFWCLMPLHADEIALKVRAGAEALFPLFDREGVTDVVQMQRPNVVRRRRLWPF